MMAKANGTCLRHWSRRMKAWMLKSWAKGSRTTLNVPSTNQCSALERILSWSSVAKMRSREPSARSATRKSGGEVMIVAVKIESRGVLRTCCLSCSVRAALEKGWVGKDGARVLGPHLTDGILDHLPRWREAVLGLCGLLLQLKGKRRWIN